MNFYLIEERFHIKETAIPMLQEQISTQNQTDIQEHINDCLEQCRLVDKKGEPIDILGLMSGNTINYPKVTEQFQEIAQKYSSGEILTFADFQRKSVYFYFHELYFGENYDLFLGQIPDANKKNRNEILRSFQLFYKNTKEAYLVDPKNNQENIKQRMQSNRLMIDSGTLNYIKTEETPPPNFEEIPLPISILDNLQGNSYKCNGHVYYDGLTLYTQQEWENALQNLIPEVQQKESYTVSFQLRCSSPPYDIFEAKDDTKGDIQKMILERKLVVNKEIKEIVDQNKKSDGKCVYYYFSKVYFEDEYKEKLQGEKGKSPKYLEKCISNNRLIYINSDKEGTNFQEKDITKSEILTLIKEEKLQRRVIYATHKRNKEATQSAATPGSPLNPSIVSDNSIFNNPSKTRRVVAENNSSLATSTDSFEMQHH